MWEKFKSILQNDQAFYSLLVLIVGCASFALGRLSTEPLTLPADTAPQQTEEVQIRAAAESLPVETAEVGSGAVVASKTGTKFHLPECPGASQIKPENLITFASVAAAVAAGYTPAGNCPGLR
jgi:Metal binding domain of Ada